MGDRRALVAREVRVDVDLRDRALTDEPMRMTPGIRRLKIKNPDYSQKEGRGDLFNGPRQRTARTAG